MRHLSEKEVAGAISLIENEVGIRQVARMFDRSPLVIQRSLDSYIDLYKRRIDF